ncbi:MAG TPA: acireductone dioxygenase [Roseomonas sp.]|jgi:1,2-dihydroxy-3-keto-5-methylthiopentene dioxygenase
MSRLTVWDAATGAETFNTQDPADIAATLDAIGVRFERWDGVETADDATPEQILAAYKPHLDALMGTSGAGSADVLSLTPDHPMKDALRQKFLDEHIHTEDEVRFFVRGGGHFVLHIGGHVWDAHCTQGDLISVPANTRHWFDAGPEPRFTALRIFTDTSGWVPHYTGTDLAKRFPVAG